jgi:hypothetical protein
LTAWSPIRSKLIVDFDDGDQKPQIHCHRLMQGQYLQALLLDFDLHFIDIIVGI